VINHAQAGIVELVNSAEKYKNEKRGLKLKTII